ncbi:MAG: acyl-CoA dehydrogenase family protein, partial [Actinomycetes bacterium]
MDLEFGAADEAFRAEVRAWLREHVPSGPLPSLETAEGFAAHRDWERTLGRARLGVVSWPAEYGGRGTSVLRWLIFEEEYYRADAPSRVTQNGIFLLAPTLFEFGTEEQRRRILPRMASADDLWAQGWSEPGAGSDLASVRSRAVRDDVRGGWRVTGQKTWTTRGAYCSHLFGLFRSDPDAERHRGLTYLMLALDAPGVTVRPFERLDGDPGFADVYLDDVFVPDEDVIGAVNGGWRVAMATTGSERGLTLRAPGRFRRQVERLLEFAEQNPAAVTSAVRERLIDSWIDAEAYQLFTLDQVTRIVDGDVLGA